MIASILVDSSGSRWHRYMLRVFSMYMFIYRAENIVWRSLAWQIESLHTPTSPVALSQGQWRKEVRVASQRYVMWRGMQEKFPFRDPRQ